MGTNTGRALLFLLLLLALFLTAQAAMAKNGDFSLQIIVNGEDITGTEAIVIDPERALKIDLHFYDAAPDVVLEKTTVVITFAGQTILSRSDSLDNFSFKDSDTHDTQIAVYPGDTLKFGDVSLITGIYHTAITIDYSAGVRHSSWTESTNIRIPGNPVSTPAGAAGIAVTGGTIAAIMMLTKSLVAPALPAGVSLPASTPIRSRPGLIELVLDRLEPTARGRLTGNIVKAARARIVKDKCPICGTRLKHGYCFTCKKPAKEVRKEYVDRVRELVIQSGKLFASGQITTVDDLCSTLGIDGKLGTSVIATLKHAKLVRVKGVTSKLMGKAVMAGIGTGLSTILWVTVGGLAVFSTSVLVGILIASVIIPVVITRSLQTRAGHKMRERKS
jgi:hypothetical protein